MKLAWKIKKGGSMWAEYMKDKYLSRSNVWWANSKPKPKKSSKLWRDMVSVLPDVLNRCHWLIGKGEIRFWADSWCGHRPLFELHEGNIDLKIKVKDMITDGAWNQQAIPTGIFSLKKNTIGYVQVKEDLPDKLIWRPEPNGSFSVKSAWECIRNPRQMVGWSKCFFFDPVVPTKISFLAWKVLHGG